VALAIDREAIVRHILGGGARTAEALLPPDHWAGVRLAGRRYDPEAARLRLAELGYGADNPLTLQLKTSTNPQRVRIAAVLQHQLRQAHIDLQVLTHEWGTFYGDIKSGRFQMYSLAWVGLKLPDIFRYAFHSSSRPPAGANRGGLTDARIDELIEQAELSRSLDEQAALYRALQTHLAETLPYVPLWYEDHVAVLRDELGDYRLLGDGTFDGLLSAHKHSADP
jgi:peptide/nickel transport system substrate-binding protein